MMLPLYAIIGKINHEPLEASADLGAGKWQTLLTVPLPLADAYRGKLILGVIAIARTRVEPMEEPARLTEALNHIDGHRPMAGPDCGLGMLDRATVRVKLTNLATAVHTVS